ncbi:MAG TPA: CZB domain-containing protein, partial [Magnetospirillum sp.]|nr:CZB domain-containing protein [Magnetospirillum sp.]
SSATSEIARSVAHSSDASKKVVSLMLEMADEARKSSDLSEEVKKDAARVTETVSGFSRTLGRVIRTSTPEVDRRRDPRYGVFVPCRVSIAGRDHDAILANLSAGGACLQVDGSQVSVGQSVTLECGALGSKRETRVIASEKAAVHVAFASERLDTAMVERVGHDGALALLEKAKSDHEAFVAGVVAVLDGKSAAKAADLANHHTCRLGKWYDAVSDQRILQCPAFAQMVEPHQRVHENGKRALMAHWHGDAEGARAAVADLRRASADVLGLLERLAGQVRGSQAPAA